MKIEFGKDYAAKISGGLQIWTEILMFDCLVEERRNEETANTEGEH